MPSPRPGPRSDRTELPLPRRPRRTRRPAPGHRRRRLDEGSRMSDSTAVLTTDGTSPNARITAAAHRALPNLREVAESAAEKEGVCSRLLPMRAVDPGTGKVSYIGVPDRKSVVEGTSPGHR